MKKRIACAAAVVAMVLVPAGPAPAWWGSCTIDGAGRLICYQH